MTWWGMAVPPHGTAPGHQGIRDCTNGGVIRRAHSEKLRGAIVPMDPNIEQTETCRAMM